MIVAVLVSVGLSASGQSAQQERTLTPTTVLSGVERMQDEAESGERHGHPPAPHWPHTPFTDKSTLRLSRAPPSGDGRHSFWGSAMGGGPSYDNCK
jgi:hypothetical protein